jgi:lipoprotein-anchoring transpeptidase ErfK/SrfK
MNTSYKPQKNARRITLFALAGAIVVIAGIFALRTFLNRDTAMQAVAAQQQQPALEPPKAQGIPLPTAAPAQQQPAPALQTPQTAPPVQPKAAASEPAQTPAIAPAPLPQPEPPAAQTQLSPDAAKLVDEADNDLKIGKFIAARDKLNDAVRMLEGNPQQAGVKTKLEQLSQMWLYGKDVLRGDTLCGTYTVRPGDSLEVIGKKFKVPYEFLMETNNIARPETLQVGQQLKIVNGPFRAIVNRSTFTMDIYLQTTYVKSYKVGLGKDGMETPTGLWRVSLGGKMIKPRWTDPKTGKTYEPDAPDYPLGSRWIGLDGVEGNAKGRTGFAIHGTKDPQTIGTRSSQGCIRLFNGDVIRVYNMMMPGQSEVRVID